MKKKRYRRWFTASVALASLSASGSGSKDAWACSGPTCEAGEVFPRSGTIPVNHFGLTWQRLSGFVVTADELRIYRVSDATPDGGFLPPGSSNDGGGLPRELSLEFDPEVVGPSDAGLGEYWEPAHVTSSEELQEGELLYVEYTAGACDPGGETVLSSKGVITLGPPAALPTDLGTLDVETGEGYVDVQLGSCQDRPWLAYATLDVQFSEGALPFADMFMYQLSVDGTRVRNYFTDHALDRGNANFSSRLSGRSTDGKTILLTADCTGSVPGDADPSLEMPVLAGTHSVVVVGVLPDGTEVASEPVDVTLNCSASVCQDEEYPHLDYPRDSGDAGLHLDADVLEPPVLAEAGAEPVEELPDSSVALDAAPSVDTANVADAARAPDVDAGEGTASGDSKAGCSCTVGATTSERSSFGLVGLLVGLSVWRRRARGL